VRFQSKLSNHGFNLVSAHLAFGNKSVDPRGSDTNSGQTNYDDLFAMWHGWKTAGLTTYLTIGVSTIAS
jgi:hypothetical protein